MSLELSDSVILEDEAVVAKTEEAEVKAEIRADADDFEYIVSPAALELRLVLIQDQMNAAARKVNLLHYMGLMRTEGYTEAMAAYEAKLAQFNGLKARLGLD